MKRRYAEIYVHRESEGENRDYSQERKNERDHSSGCTGKHTKKNDVYLFRQEFIPCRNCSLCKYAELLIMKPSVRLCRTNLLREEILFNFKVSIRHADSERGFGH